jgi:hypothetical protein
MAKRNPGGKPFADYKEWAQHRYDPGHYLGGRIAPHLRRSRLGARARRRSALLLAAFGVLSLPAAVFPPEPVWLARPLVLAFMILVLTAAGRMWVNRA